MSANVRKTSIRKRLVGLIMLICTVAILLACSAFFSYSWLNLRSRQVRDLSTHAALMASTCQVALAFDDAVDGSEALTSLQATPTTAYGLLMRPDGSSFAEYRRLGFALSPQARPDETGFRFDSDWLVVEKAILLNGEKIGSVFLQSDLSELTAFYQQSAITIFIIIVAVLLIIYVLTLRLQGVISTPIAQLAQTASQISGAKDYSTRAQKHANDEIGELTDAFNDMLEQIEKRDQALRQGAELLRATFESTGDGLLVIDATGKIAEYNDNFVKMWQISEDVLATGDINKMIASVSREVLDPGGFKQKIEQLTQSDSESIDEITLKGDRVFERVSCPLIMDGRATGRVSSFRDVSESKKAAHELNSLRSLLSNVIDSMPSIIASIDTEHRVLLWNREAAILTGVSPEQAKGRKLPSLLPQMSQQLERLQEAIAQRNPQFKRALPVESDDQNRFWDLTIYPLVSNGVEGAVVRMDDVTERVRIEEMMIQSEKMLSVGGLAAGMAHELNNPLAGILQNVQVLRNRLLGDLRANQAAANACGIDLTAIADYAAKRDLPQTIDTILSSGKRAVRIIENMLNFSQKSDDHFAAHDLAKLLDDTLELAANDYDMKKKYDFRKIEIARHYQADTPKVMCESVKIQQVFLNLLKNGAQAMTANNAPRRARPRFDLRVSADQELVQVEVEDNGVGMDVDCAKRVFEPFFTTKEVGVGTGLGLSISYFIITENHGGTITVETQPGKGARFIVRLPQRRQLREVAS